MYSPALKGLHNVHTFICQTLEELTFRLDETATAAAYLYGECSTDNADVGHCLAMTPVSHDLIQLAVENLLIKNAHEISLCLLLGVKRSNPALFAHHLSTLLRQIQVTAFSLQSTAITQDALCQAMKLYTGPTEQSKHIVASTHALFDASLRLAAGGKQRGLFWACFIIVHTPMASVTKSPLMTAFAQPTASRICHRCRPSLLRLVAALWQPQRRRHPLPLHCSAYTNHVEHISLLRQRPSRTSR